MSGDERHQARVYSIRPMISWAPRTSATDRIEERRPRVAPLLSPACVISRQISPDGVDDLGNVRRTRFLTSRSARPDRQCRSHAHHDVDAGSPRPCSTSPAKVSAPTAQTRRSPICGCRRSMPNAPWQRSCALAVPSRSSAGQPPGRRVSAGAYGARSTSPASPRRHGKKIEAA